MEEQPKRRTSRLNVFALSVFKKPSVSENNVIAGKTSSFILRHDSRAKTVWDGLVLLAIIYVSLTVPFSVTFLFFDHTGPTILYTLISDNVVEMLFLVDIILNFFTTYEESGQVVHEMGAIVRNYINTWFFVDLLAVMPIDLLHVFTIPKPSYAHLLKAIRLLRLLRLFQKLDRYSQNPAIVLTVLMSAFALLAHWMACIWYVIGRSDLQSKENVSIGWLHQLSKNLDKPFVNGTIGGPTLYSTYVTALYFTLTSLTTVGFGNVCANTDAEKIFSICTMLIGALLYSMIFGTVPAVLQRMFSRRFGYNTRVNYLKEFSNIHCLPNQLRERMLLYHQEARSIHHGINVKELLSDLPEDIQADIALCLHKDILQLPIFTGANRGCLRSLFPTIKTSFCVPGEYLLCQGDALQANYYVCSGSLEVRKDGIVLAILGKGTLFGSDLPGSEKVIRANFDVKARTYSVLEHISLPGLKEVLEIYPENCRVYVSNINKCLAYNLGAVSQNEDNNLACGQPGQVTEIEMEGQMNDVQDSDECQTSGSTKKS